MLTNTATTAQMTAPIDYRFPTSQQLVRYGLRVISHFSRRIEKWDERPIVDLTCANEDAKDELMRELWPLCLEANALVSSAANCVENLYTAPTADLILEVANALLSLLVPFRNFLWTHLAHRFEVELDSAESDADIAGTLHNVYPVVCKDIVESSLIITFLQQMRDKVLGADFEMPRHHVAAMA